MLLCPRAGGHTRARPDGVGRHGAHRHLQFMKEFTGHPAYGPGELCSDLERFVFLLGGSDGEASWALTGSLPVWRPGTS
jgi:hypothetical protein